MMKAGTYYVGDLCYVMHDSWDEVCEIGSDDRIDGEHTLASGVKYAIFSTAWGDGEYYDGMGRRYLVDSGTLGCVLVVDLVAGHGNDTSGGQIITFERDFTPRTETPEMAAGARDDSIICFGARGYETVAIQTDEQEEEDEDQDEFDEFDDE